MVETLDCHVKSNVAVCIVIMPYSLHHTKAPLCSVLYKLGVNNSLCLKEVYALHLETLSSRISSLMGIKTILMNADTILERKLNCLLQGLR